MSYALGAASVPQNQEIRIGRMVETDPIMSASSLMTSRLILQSMSRPREERLGWLEGELNKAQPGLGNDVVSKINELVRSGKPSNQALFDGMRLTLANFFAKRFAEMKRGGVSGLGGSTGDINAVACLMMGTIGSGGVTASGLMQNPAGSRVIGESTAGLMGANSCNAESLRAQAAVINAQAALAAASGGGASIVATASPNTVLYIGLGIGALALVGGGLFIALKK